MIEHVGPEGFDGDRLRRPGVVIVAFLADWCGFCDRFVPALEGFERLGLSVVVADVSDEASPLWDRFHVEVVPTVVVFRDGRPSFRVDGVRSVGLGAAEVEAIVRAAAPGHS